jgi:hypothetical protein
VWRQNFIQTKLAKKPHITILAIILAMAILASITTASLAIILIADAATFDAKEKRNENHVRS